MPAPKFSFVPERQIGKDSDETYKVSIFKNSALRFPSEIVRVYELKDKYVRLFADLEKKAIGWQIVEGKTDLDTLSDARLMTVRKAGIVVLGIGKLLNKLGFEKGVAFSNLEVKKYKSVLDDRDIWYIELDKKI